MCTAFKFNNCMGRNYDYEMSYDENILTVPRNKNGNKYAMIGICTGLMKEYPLWYDSMNEHGLCISALAFTGNAHYNKEIEGKENIPAYDVINRLCGNFKTVESIKEYLKNVNITDEPYNDSFPTADLHWLICDKNDCITLESTKTGIRIYDNYYGVLTNNPPFDRQVKEADQMDKIIGTLYYPGGICKSRGTETVGIKGDMTSMGRFHRVHYYKSKMEQAETRICNDDVSAFHLLDIVKQTWGATPVDNSYEYTIYSAVYDMENMELAVKPYYNTRIRRFLISNRERRYKV